MSSALKSDHSKGRRPRLHRDQPAQSRPAQLCRIHRLMDGIESRKVKGKMSYLNVLPIRWPVRAVTICEAFQNQDNGVQKRGATFANDLKLELRNTAGMSCACACAVARRSRSAAAPGLRRHRRSLPQPAAARRRRRRP